LECAFWLAFLQTTDFANKKGSRTLKSVRDPVINGYLAIKKANLEMSKVDPV